MSTRQTTMSPDCFVHLDDFGLPNPEPRDKGVAKPRRHSDASQIEGTSPADGIAIGKKARFKESYVYEVLTDDESDSEVQEERKQRKISPTSHFLSGMPRDVRLTRKAANQIMPKETRKASNEFGQIEHQNKQLEKAEKRLKPKKEPLMGPPKRKKSYKLTEPETDSQEDTDKARRQSQPPRKKAKEANRRATISNPYSLSVNEHLADKEHSGDMKLRNKNNRAREEAECGNIKTEYKETIINLNAEVKGLKDEVHSLTQQGHSLRLENSSLRQTQATMVAKLGRGEGNKDSRRKITELVNLMDATASAILGTDYKDPADIANLLEGGEMLQKRVKREREDGYGEGCHGFGEQTNSEYQSHDN